MNTARLLCGSGISMMAVNEQLAPLFDRYAAVEKEIQNLIYPLSRRCCRKCAGKCCREEICRESIESPFLYLLVEKQGLRYHRRNGWLSDAGCRLDYGRPVVCYSYFCDEIIDSHVFPATYIQRIVAEFASIGDKAHGDAHLLCIEDLNVLSPIKIDKMCHRISRLLNKIARPWGRYWAKGMRG